MKKIIVVLFLFGFVYPLSATEQMADLFIFKNQTFYIPDIPIDYLDRFLPSEVGNKIRKTQIGYMTACYRGYIATWTLEGDSLFLTKLETWKGETLPLENYFPGKVTSQGVFADWFNYMINAGTEDIMSSGKYKESIRFFGRFKEGILVENRLSPKK